MSGDALTTALALGAMRLDKSGTRDAVMRAWVTEHPLRRAADGSWTHEPEVSQ